MTVDELATRIASDLGSGEAKVIGPQRRHGDWGWDITVVTPDGAFRVRVEEAE